MTDTTSPPRGRPEVVFRTVGDEWVLWAPAGDRLHTLNRTAAMIWTLCDGETPPRAMVQALGELLDEAPARSELETAVRETLATFRDEGLLE